MTSEQIIKQGELIKISTETDIAFFAFGVVGLILMVVWAVWASIKESPFAGLSYLGVIILGFLLIFANTDYYKNQKYQKEIYEWEKTAVEPYLEKLPLEKGELIKLVQTEQGSYNVKFKDSDGEIQEVESVFVEKSIYGDGPKNEMEKPSVEYTKLRTDLGHGVVKGIQRVKVYVPNPITKEVLEKNESIK